MNITIDNDATITINGSSKKMAIFLVELQKQQESKVIPEQFLSLLSRELENTINRPYMNNE